MTSPLDHVRRLFPAPGPPGLFERAVITVSFHPDRLLADGSTVAEHLVADGAYHSQFRTGISNGGLGGDRDAWEQRMFPGVYHSTEAARSGPGRALDDYVEAQVHGGLRLPGDVTAVVADASFRGTRFEPLLARLGSVLTWSPAFRLPPEEFPPDLRGPSVPPLAHFIATRYRTAVLDAAVLGRAARSVVRDPAPWSSFGPPAEVLQLIKYLWHILVLRGTWSDPD